MRNKEKESWLAYDKLILAQGGNPITPSVPRADDPYVYKLWIIPDMDRMHAIIETDKPQSAVVVGGGCIGSEMAEALTKRGLSTTVVKRLPTVMATMDPEFGHQIASELVTKGVTVVTCAQVESIADRQVILGDGRHLPADLVLFSGGVQLELTLAKKAGLSIGPSEGLEVGTDAF